MKLSLCGEPLTLVKIKFVFICAIVLFELGYVTCAWNFPMPMTDVVIDLLSVRLLLAVMH